MNLLKIEEVAEMLRCDKRTVRRYCVRGFLKGAFKLAGNRWRIPAEAVYGLFEKEDNETKVCD